MINSHALGDGSIDSTVQISSLTPNGPALQDDDSYGSAIAGLGDLDNDGVDDIAVGAFHDSIYGYYHGAIYIHFMYADGSIKSTVKIDESTTNGPVLNTTDAYGRALANMGDLDGDGVVDIAVGATGDDAGGSNRGTVYIHFLNTDASIKSTVEINDLTINGPVLNNEDRSGAEVDNLGDLNGDGVVDIAIGAIADDAGGTDRGAVHICFLNTDGSVDSTVEINDLTANGPTLNNSDVYGRAVSAIGDLNGDGVTDIVAGANQSDIGGSNRGVVFIHFMNTDGSVDSTVTISSLTANGPILENEERYGAEARGIGDLNGDSVPDIAVGSAGGAVGSGGLGVVYIHFMNTDGSIDVTVEMGMLTPNGPELVNDDRYGGSIANISDMNGDGVQDLAVGATQSNVGGTGRGMIHIHFMGNLMELKDVMSRLATNSPSDHAISFGTKYGLNESGETFTLAFDPESNQFDLATLAITDIQLSDTEAIVRTLAASAGTDTWGVSINIANDIITFSAPTSGSGYYPASGHVVINLGLNSGGVGQVGNPTQTGTYKIMATLHNSGPIEQGELSLPIVDNDQVNVTSYINTFISFDIDTATSPLVKCPYNGCQLYDTAGNAANYTVDMGELNSSYVNKSQDAVLTHSDGGSGTINSIYFSLTTNAWNGAILIVTSANSGLKGSGSNLIASVLNDGDDVTVNSGLYGFTLPEAGSGNGTVARNSFCQDTSHYCRLITSPVVVFDTAGRPLDSGRLRMDLAAASSAIHNPGNYTDTLTFIATATY